MNREIFCYGLDLSEDALELFKAKEEFDPKRVILFPFDISKQVLTLPPRETGEEGVDIVSAIFVLSAIFPSDILFAIRNMHRVLKRNGLVIVRDYAQDDFASTRFKEDRRIDLKSHNDNDENGPSCESLFVRQDGTFTQFFSKEILEGLFCGKGESGSSLFTLESIEVVERNTVNKRENFNADRKFIQARFRKASPE